MDGSECLPASLICLLPIQSSSAAVFSQSSAGTDCGKYLFLKGNEMRVAIAAWSRLEATMGSCQRVLFDFPDEDRDVGSSLNGLRLCL